MRKCSVNGCAGQSVNGVHGLCKRHFRRARKGEEPQPVKATYPHGHRYRYQYGCGCDECREANNAKSRTYESPSTITTPVDCLIAAGADPERLGRMIPGAAPELHWHLWRTDGRFRYRCRCELPSAIVAWLEERDVA